MRIWLVMDGHRWTFEEIIDGSTPALGGGIGGAEAMTLGMAQALMRRGHDVIVWTPVDPSVRIIGCPISWREIAGLSQEPDGPDVLIAVRRPESFTLPNVRRWRDTTRVLWAQDVAPDPFLSHDHFMACMADADAILYMSHWQRDQWHKVYKLTLPSAITPAGIDPNWIVDGEHKRNVFLYGSRPERGLEPLLAMWPRIKALVTDAKLLVTGYLQGVDTDIADRLIHTQMDPSIEIVRCDDKPGFFAQLSRARLLLYPGVPWFRETCGHIAEDAMAAGVVPLVSRLGAMPETVPIGTGITFPGESTMPAYQTHFVNEVARLALHPADEEIARRVAAGHTHVMPRCDFESIATLWESFRSWAPRGVNV
jgi:glycosyltransferase involved in cell wall biosynthesis